MHRNFLEEAATIDECITSPYRGSGGCSDENNVLKLLQHPEGRVLPDGANWEYQYFLKDHLGNVRITFTAKTQAATNYTTDFEASTNANFQNYSNTTFDLVDHTDAAGTVYQKVQWLNGGVNGRVGLAKSLAVMPGDQVSITAYAKYMNLGTTANPNAFITSLAAAFGVSSGSTGEALKIYNGLNSYATTIPGGDHYQDNESAPKAFVTIIFFDKDYNLIDAAWDQVTTTGAQTSPTVKQPPHDVMSISAKAPEAGYAFVFVSNEHFNYVDVYFDDVTVGHTPSPIVSTSDYFPFGLSYNSMERAGGLEQKYMYNGKELQDEMALNWYDYGARMYMPEIGRWGVVDPLSEKFLSWSPYTYANNNPTRFTDPLGLEGEDEVKNGELPENEFHGQAEDGNWYATTYFYGNDDTGASTTVSGCAYCSSGIGFGGDLLAAPTSIVADPPYKLNGANLSTIMEAFQYAFDLASRKQEEFTMSQVFDFEGLIKDGSSHRSSFTRTFTEKGGVMLELTLNVQEKGTAPGYDGRIIDFVQPYYKHAPTWKEGKSWEQDPNKIPTSAKIGTTVLTGYPYAISIYGTYHDNNRMATLYFNNLAEFKQFMVYVNPNVNKK